MSKSKLKVQTIAGDLNQDSSSGIFDQDGQRAVELQQWDMNKMRPHDVNDLEHGCKAIIIGKPGTGKSRLIQSIMFYKAHIFPVAQIYSGTESVNHFFATMSTDITIYEKLDLKALENFARRQDISRKYLPNPWCLNILDDVTEDSAFFSKAIFKAAFTKGRHWAMLLILAVQYAMDVKPAMRCCIDYLYILPNSNNNERQSIYDNFGSSAFPTFQDFCDIMDQLEEHEALVIDNTILSGPMKDRVFLYKADPSIIPADWKFGSIEAWEFNKERMDPSYQSSIF